MFCFMDMFDDPLDVRGNFCHVNVYMGGCHSQVGGISSLLYHLGYMNQAFAWDAASVQTVTSQAFLIDQQDTGTERGCNSCSSQPTRSSPNDSYVVVHTSHRTSPFHCSVTNISPFVHDSSLGIVTEKGAHWHWDSIIMLFLFIETGFCFKRKM